MDVKEVAQMLGVSQGTIYKMARLNEIPHKKMLGRLIFHRETIEKWLVESEVN